MTENEWGALHARVPKEEQDKARLRAAQLGMTVAEYIRQIVTFDIKHEILRKR